MSTITIMSRTAKRMTTFTHPASRFATLLASLALLALAPRAGAAVSATGGTITDITGYRVHTFTHSGTFSVAADGNVEVLNA